MHGILRSMNSGYYRDHLCRQLEFISRSCDSFDRGFEDEAVRIAVSIRVMIHDTQSSTSLLKHLQARDIRLLSTCLDIVAKLQDPWLKGGRLRMFNGMGQYTPGQTPPYRPSLGNSYSHYFARVNDWWTQPVFVLDPDTWVMRGDVVLTAANKDGGAHVDSKLTPEYERLVASGDLGCLVAQHGTEEIRIPISGHHYVALRQMGYELLNSPELCRLAA